MTILRLLVLNVVVGSSNAISMTCTSRYAPFQNTGTNATFAMIECIMSEDLYVTANGNKGPYKTDISGAALATKLTADGLGANQNFAQGYTSPSGGGTMPGVSTMWNGNFYLECGNQRLDDSAPMKAPTDYLFLAPPTKDPLDGVMAAFGAKLEPQTQIPRKVVGVFFPEMIEKGQKSPTPINKAAWEQCLSNGTAKLVMTAKDYTAKDVGAFANGKFANLAMMENPPYTFTDKDKKVINGGAKLEAVVTRYNLPAACTKDGAVQVAKDFAKLDVEMAGVTTRSQLRQIQNTFTALQARMEFSSCRALMEDLYKETWENVELTGTRACTHEFNTTGWKADPCCNPVQAWSKCCAERTTKAQSRRCANVNGVCTVTAAKLEKCEAKYKTAVKNVIEQVVAPSIFETQHPEFGCEKTAQKNANEDDWETHVSWMSQCEMAIMWEGKTKTDQSKCTADSECYTGRCATQNGQTKCERASGIGSLEPLFRCMLHKTGAMKIGKYIAAEIGVDPTKINDMTPGTDAVFVAALAKWRAVLTEKNCAGESSRGGWCVNSLAKADCEALATTETGGHAVKWIVDPSNAALGWCKMVSRHGPSNGVCPNNDDPCGWGEHYSHMAKTKLQLMCDTATKLMGACKTDSSKKTKSDCETASKTWLPYGAGTYHRLETMKIWGQNTTTGNHEETLETGDQNKCVAEKGCNWDPRGYEGGTTEALCKAPTNKADVAGTGSDVGKKFFCGQCSTENDCHARMSISTCVVRPWEYPDSAKCASESGHVQWTVTDAAALLGSATYEANPHQKRGDRVWNKCMRTDAAHDTMDECLPKTICPKSVPNQETDVENGCARPFCWDTSKIKTACTGDNFHWREDLKEGAGLCVRQPWNSGLSSYTKTACEATANHRWWEGRSWKGGFLDTKTNCETGFCQDGKPGQEFRKTCSNSKVCTKRCKLCVSNYRHQQGSQSKMKMCYDSSITVKTACSTTGLEWDATAEVCKKTSFSGTKADCTAFGANYVYKDCGSFPKAQCQAGCHLSAYTKANDCYGKPCTNCRADWDWQAEKCFAKGFTNGDPAKGNRHDYPIKAQCDAAGATPVFTATEASFKQMASMQCRYENWAECPEEASCKAAGDCADWHLERGSMVGSNWVRRTGSCVLPPEVHLTTDHENGGNQEAGRKKECHQYQPSMDHAGLFGCIHKTTVDKAACTALATSSKLNYTWITRAENKTGCLAHGGGCRDRFQEWVVYGGVKDSASCTSCGTERAWEMKAEWHGGSWKEPEMFTGKWKARAWVAKNTWAETVVRYKLANLANKAVSRMYGEVFRTSINCKLGPLVGPLLTVACGCAGGSSTVDCASAVKSFTKVSLATSTVFCNAMDKTTPLSLAAGSVSYGKNSTCPAGSNASATESVSKVAVSGTTGRRLSDVPRRLASCAAHSIIKSGGVVCGQKMGTALSSAIAGVELCINPNVPTGEVCSEYSIMDFAMVDNNGVVGLPLNLVVTLDKKGRYCGTTTTAGTHLPIKRAASCKSAANGGTANSALVAHAGRSELSWLSLAAAAAGLWATRLW